MAASLANFPRQFLRLISVNNSAPFKCLTPVRHYKRGTSKVLREFYERRLIVGPDKERKRSEWVNWNYNAEIYSFGKRLNEEFVEETLKTALVDKSYVEQELERRKDVQSPDQTLSFNLDDNEKLSKLGRDVAGEYVKTFLRHQYPRLPEEGVTSVHDYLMSRRVLSNVGKHIGIYDIVLCEGFPDEDTLEQSFLAVIGCLVQDSGEECAHRFVQDFLLPELVQKDINNLWNIVDPMGLLEKILAAHERSLPEPRLLHSCGRETVVAVFTVGIYSDKELIGKGFGETSTIAEEEAARDALQRIFMTELHNQQMPFEGPLVDDASPNQKQLEA